MRFHVVSFHCVLKNQFGHVLSTSFNQDVTTRDPNNKAPALIGFSKALEKLKPGQREEIFVEAHEAYGLYDPTLKVEASKSKLRNGKSLKVGDEVDGTVNGTSEIRKFRVVSVSAKSVVLDANHPLAGQDLIFDVELTASKEIEDFAGDHAVREAMLN